MESGFAEKNF